MSGPPPAAPLPPEIAAENKGPMMLALTWTFTSLAGLFVLGRLFSRKKKMGRLLVDDWIIIGSLVCLGAAGATETCTQTKPSS
jgi:hypothetical protein